MGTQELMTQLFLKGFIEPTPEMAESVGVLASRGFIKLNDRGQWIENEEVTNRILYPPICGCCQKQGPMSAWSPYCGYFCSNSCLVEHSRSCRQCGISLAMEK